jgi:hypothetical protein
VLQRLVRADRAPERHAVLRVLEGELVDAVHRTDGLCVLQRQRHLELSFDVGGGVAHPAHHGGRVDGDVGELEHAEAAAHVERLQGPHGDPRGAGGDQELREALTGAGGHEPVVGDRCVLDVRLGAREHPSAVTFGGGERDPARVPAAGRLRERPGGDPLPAHQRGERLLLVGTAGPGEGVGDDVHREERSGRDQPPHLLRHQHEVEQPRPADAAAAELLGDQHRGPSQLGAPPPVLAFERHRVLVEVAHVRERALGLEEASRRLDEQLLIVLQLELHRRSSPRRARPHRC